MADGEGVRRDGDDSRGRSTHCGGDFSSPALDGGTDGLGDVGGADGGGGDCGGD